jgi:hypothetical protein
VPRLNIVAVVSRVLHFWLDVGFLARVAGIWFVVIALADLAEHLLATPDEQSWLTLMANLFNGIVTTLAYAACAIAVHRSILLNERPGQPRLGRPEICYVLRGILVFLPLILAIFLWMMGIAIWGGGVSAIPLMPMFPGSVSWVIGQLLVGVIVLPFALSLPALAIGNLEFYPRDGWRVIRGNFFRLVAAYLLAFSLPSLLIKLVALGVKMGIGFLGSSSAILVYATELLTAMLDTVLFAAALSCTYAALVRGDPELVLPPRDVEATS